MLKVLTISRPRLVKLIVVIAAIGWGFDVRYAGAVTQPKELYATTVPMPSPDNNGWDWEGQAEGLPPDTCVAGSPPPVGSGNTAQQKFSSNPNGALLTATTFETYAVPVGEHILKVEVDVKAGHVRTGSQTSGDSNLDLVLTGSASAQNFISQPLITDGALDCQWRMQLKYPGGKGWDVTSLFGTLNAAAINNLNVGVSRRSGNENLYVSGFRIVVTTAADPPAAPTTLTLSSITDSQIRLNWGAGSGGGAVENFDIERRIPPAAFSLLTSVAGGTTTYLDGGVSENTSYEYRIKARNATDPPAYGNTAGATTLIFPAKLAFSQQPPSAQVCTVMAPATSVVVRSVHDNLVPNATNAVTLTLATNSCGGVLSGTLNRNAASGVAGFADLSVNRSCTGYTLSATSPGLTPATSAPFGVTAASPNAIVAALPTDNATDVDRRSDMTLTYARPVDPATVTAGSLYLLAPDGSTVPTTRSVSPAGTALTLHPLQPLVQETTYRVEATSGILEVCSAAPSQLFESYFRTSSAIIPLVTSTGVLSAPQSKFGTAVAGAGDLTGTGLNNLVAGAGLNSFVVGVPADQSPGTPVESGSAMVFLGASGVTPDIVFTGESAHDRAGTSVAANFDFNGDGRLDILVGAEQVDKSSGPNPVPVGTGKAYLIFFDAMNCNMNPRHCNAGADNHVSLSRVGKLTVDGIPGIVFLGESLGDRAGFSVAGVGNPGAPSSADLLIGAPGRDLPQGKVDAGVVYEYFDHSLSTGTVPLSAVADNPAGIAFLGETGDALGSSVAFVGSIVQGESGPHIAMGAPGSEIELCINDCGKVALRRKANASDSDTTTIVVDSLGRTAPGVQVGGTQDNEQLGWAVADGGDNRKDDVPDLLIGAPLFDTATKSNVGRVIQTSQMLPQNVCLADSISGAIWTGEGAEDRLGSAVGRIGKVNGDEFDDVAFGAPGSSPRGKANAGTVYVAFGSAQSGTGTVVSAVSAFGDTLAGEQRIGTESGEHAGSSIAGLGHAGPSGPDVYLVGAPDHGASDAGAVYIVGGPGSCGPLGCRVADLRTGAEVEVPAFALNAPVTLGTTGILSGAGLPAPVPAGKMLLGAAAFTPEGQTFLAGVSIHVPTVQGLESQLTNGEPLHLYVYSPSMFAPSLGGWVDTGLTGVVETNPSYPERKAVQATVSALHVYAYFLDDADGDGIRTERDCAPNDASTFSVPGAIGGFGWDADKTTLLWQSAVPNAGSGTVHQVVRGALEQLPVTGRPSDVCLSASIAGTSIADPALPTAAQGWWYLARGRNNCGAGTYGTASSGTARVAAACP